MVISDGVRNVIAGQTRLVSAKTEQARGAAIDKRDAALRRLTKREREALAMLGRAIERLAG